MKVNFYEIDNGPGGLTWTAMKEDYGFLRSYETEGEMLDDAAFVYSLDGEVRFYTQAEWNLEVRVEMALEHMEDSYG